MNLRKTKVFLIVFLLVWQFFGPYLSHVVNTKAYGVLENAVDTVSTVNFGYERVPHNVAYTLPAGAEPLNSNEWIIIDMPNFTEVNPPTSVSGLFGEPIFDQVGKRVRVTNVSQVPGTTAHIFGIQANNPYDTSQFYIDLMISRNAEGTDLRYKSRIIVSEQGAYITVGGYIESPLTSFVISGYTAPNSFVTIFEGVTTAGTTTSDLSGRFNFNLTGIADGFHSYKISSTDQLKRSTAQTSLNIYLIKGTITTATNVLLSPSISLDKTEISPGDTITIAGSAKPNSQVNLFIESPIRSYNTQSDTNGQWSQTISSNETKTFNPGEYRTYAFTQDVNSNQSIVSNTLTFTVKTLDVDNPEPVCIVDGVESPADISKGDLNCDGKVNLTDFSILLYHWKTNHKKADINKDGSVSLTDFSIMMYYFRR